MSECSIQLHVRIIYVILLINITICTVCLYFLTNRQIDGGNKNIGISNYHISTEYVENITKRTKRDFPGLQAVSICLNNLVNAGIVFTHSSYIITKEWLQENRMVPMTTFHYERPWCRIYQKSVLRTKLNICVNRYILNCHIAGLVWLMVFNATFNSSSVIFIHSNTDWKFYWKVRIQQIHCQSTIESPYYSNNFSFFFLLMFIIYSRPSEESHWTIAFKCI